MNPIVDGIQQEAKGRYEVIKLNALAEGKAAFEHYRLPGHPSYIVFRADGTKLWSHVGIRTREELLEQLDKAAK
jgi:hypothetical protein